MVSIADVDYVHQPKIGFLADCVVLHQIGNPLGLTSLNFSSDKIVC